MDLSSHPVYVLFSCSDPDSSSEAPSVEGSDSEQIFKFISSYLEGKKLLLYIWSVGNLIQLKTCPVSE